MVRMSIVPVRTIERIKKFIPKDIDIQYEAVANAYIFKDKKNHVGVSPSFLEARSETEVEEMVKKILDRLKKLAKK